MPSISLPGSCRQGTGRRRVCHPFGRTYLIEAVKVAAQILSQENRGAHWMCLDVSCAYGLRNRGLQ